MFFSLLVCALLAGCSAYQLGADDDSCYSLSATAAGNFTHGAPVGYVPQGLCEYSVSTRVDINGNTIYNVTFAVDTERPMSGWAVQIRDNGEVGSNKPPPRGIMQSRDSVRDRSFPCPSAVGSGDYNNGVTHRDSTLGEKYSLSFDWYPIIGDIDDTPDCGRIVTTLMGTNGNWWHALKSDCIVGCNRCDDVQTPSDCDTINIP